MLADRAALGVLIGGLAAAGIARSTVVPDAWHLPYNVATGVGAVAIARLAGLSAAELGCARRDVPSGLRLGAPVLAAIVGVLGAAAAAGVLDDDRTQVGAGAMAWKVLVAIPVGTVLVEELAFRGALHGLLARVTTPGRSLAVGAVLFGLWHLPPIWDEPWGTRVGTVVATTVAGIGFIALRRRSGSVVAPMLAHLGTNSGAFAWSWIASR